MQLPLEIVEVNVEVKRKCYSETIETLQYWLRIQRVPRKYNNHSTTLLSISLFKISYIAYKSTKHFDKYLELKEVGFEFLLPNNLTQLALNLCPLIEYNRF